jgi:hypothetical protein
MGVACVVSGADAAVVRPSGCWSCARRLCGEDYLPLKVQWVEEGLGQELVNAGTQGRPLHGGRVRDLNTGESSSSFDQEASSFLSRAAGK